jgi:hypothetical protein
MVDDVVGQQVDDCRQVAVAIIEDLDGATVRLDVLVRVLRHCVPPLLPDAGWLRSLARHANDAPADIQRGFHRRITASTAVRRPARPRGATARAAGQRFQAKKRHNAVDRNTT